ISRRLGMGSRRGSAAHFKKIWEAVMPPESYYALHINLIQHGRTICHARAPLCDSCPLQFHSDYFLGTGEWATEEAEEPSFSDRRAL
ncbi:MAG: hypothetical protein KDE31_03180, partial [Caldilineaceae bacterium]|nr:hypothetical protein [Caldilineaceae bacterium]